MIRHCLFMKEKKRVFTFLIRQALRCEVMVPSWWEGSESGVDLKEGSAATGH